MKTLSLGTQLRNGQYVINGVLGQGGFGITYLATDRNLGIEIALKELYPSKVAFRGRDGTIQVDAKFEEDFQRYRDNFRQEAQTLLGLRHTSIVRVLASFEENGTAYMAMELLEGETLATRIRRQGHISETEARNMMVVLLGALAEMHSKGLLHRDIKPDNIMLSQHGPILLDFGTALPSGNNLISKPTLTPAYAPLEQYLRSGQFGATTDIYALGATFYHALGGILPPSSLERANGAEVPLLLEIEPTLANAIHHAMEMQIPERPQSALEMLAEIQHMTTASVSPARIAMTTSQQPLSPVELESLLKQGPMVQNRWWYVMGGALVVLVLGAVMWQSNQNAKLQVAAAAATAAAQAATTQVKATPVAATEASIEPATAAIGVNPAKALQPAQAEALYQYQGGKYPEAIAKLDAWLNQYPADPLMQLMRNNALHKQLDHQLISIGVSAPIGGDKSEVGTAMLQGINMAVQEANAKGIKGRYVVAEVLDDRYDRAAAVQVASEFQKNKDILAVVGPASSSSALAAASIYAGVPNLLPTATDDRLAQAGSTIYRLSPTNSAQGKALARVAAQRKFKHVVVILDPTDAYSRSLGDAFIEEAKVSKLETYRIEYQVGDSLPTSLNTNTIEAFFISGSYTEVGRLSQLLHQRGLKQPVLAGDAAYSQDLLTEAGVDVEGLQLTTFYHPSQTVGKTFAFVQNFNKMYPKMVPNARVLQSYDATKALLTAVERSKDLSRAGINQALQDFKKTPAAGTLGNIAFDANGTIVNRSLVLVQVDKGQFIYKGAVQ